MGKAYSDLEGKKFNRLTVVQRIGLDKYNCVIWRCRCDCGNELYLSSNKIVNGYTKSCGCLAKEISSRQVIEKNTKHGLAKHPLYATWKNIRQRCSNPNNTHYKSYGGRGIAVAKEWGEFKPFYDWAISNGWEKGLSIERIDNNGDYCPANCCFIPLNHQNRNKQNTVKITYDGQTRPLFVWCQMYGLRFKTCYNRLRNYGWNNPKEILFGRGA